MRKLFRKIAHSIGKDFAEATAEYVSRRPSSALKGEIHRRALTQSADIVENQMPDAVFCSDKFSHLEHASSLTGEGLVLEFGVYQGFTTNHLAKLFPDRTIHGFDSFKGLPEDWAGYRHSKHNFDQGGKKPKVLSNVELVEGWFDDSIPKFIEQHDGKVALAHIDCDIYSSTVTILENLAPRFQKGSLIVFDEFFNYPGFRNHEYRAFFEFVEKYKLDYSFVSYAGQQVGVRVNQMP